MQCVIWIANINPTLMEAAYYWYCEYMYSLWWWANNPVLYFSAGIVFQHSASLHALFKMYFIPFSHQWIKRIDPFVTELLGNVWYIVGLVRDCSNAIALALELLQSCTNLNVHTIVRHHVIWYRNRPWWCITSVYSDESAVRWTHISNLVLNSATNHRKGWSFANDIYRICSKKPLMLADISNSNNYLITYTKLWGIMISSMP